MTIIKRYEEWAQCDSVENSCLKLHGLSKGLQECLMGEKNIKVTGNWSLLFLSHHHVLWAAGNSELSGSQVVWFATENPYRHPHLCLSLAFVPLSLSFSLNVLGLHSEDRKSGRWGYVSDKSVWFSAVWIIKSICADSDLNLLGSDAAGRIQGLGDACGAGGQLRWHYSTHAPACLKQKAYHTQGQEEMMDGWEWVSPRDMEHTKVSAWLCTIYG